MTARKSARRAPRPEPGLHAALNVPSRGEALVLGGLNRHRGPLAEGAVEDDRLAGPGELVDEAALVDIVLKVGIGRVQRAGNGAGPLPLALLAQIDHRNVRLADETLRLGGGEGPAAARDLLLMQALMDV